MSDSAPRGPWTPANVVTVVRIALIPVFLVLVSLSVPPTGAVSPSRMAVAVFFALLAMTDKLDGYLARSRGEVTTFGKFLDPIADKLVVTTALLVLLVWQVVPVWMVVVIIAREFLVSGIRMVVATQGVVIAASGLGKWKTATTMCAIVGYLLAYSLPDGGLASFLGVCSTLALWAAVILTIVSGLDYFMKSKDYLLVDAGEPRG
ncbi:MAG: CDP-diacylglycerol--glycerol-3-phosphate 3-phosphatidyltransferase [Atopobiaceae bacterium]|jgi:CDP-diacylglycerol--glycerol-3-phosphate 3-phosphatidyltransferase|nr:CDP-diacylglycerol--glycerol-3-phosphate 3-phosphatidyltransferase [Atopobiaceae bacterium]